MTNQFDLVGYSSVFIMKNIGSMFIFLNMQLALVIAALTLKYFNLAIWKNKKIDAFVRQVSGARTIEFFKKKLHGSMHCLFRAGERNEIRE